MLLNYTLKKHVQINLFLVFSLFSHGANALYLYSWNSFFRIAFLSKQIVQEFEWKHMQSIFLKIFTRCFYFLSRMRQIFIKHTKWIYYLCVYDCLHLFKIVVLNMVYSLWNYSKNKNSLNNSFGLIFFWLIFNVWYSLGLLYSLFNKF